MGRLNCTPLLLVGCLIIGVCVVKISELLTVDYENIANVSVTTSSEQQLKFDSPILDDKLRHIIWFMQISDLHLSHFSDKGRTEDFKGFCRTEVRAIQPSLVLASGDLTDGKTVDTYGSRQFKQEWQMYKEAITQTGVSRMTKWLDLRGNHDNFDVTSTNSSENYFRTYSVQGPNHPRSYLYDHKEGHDTYSFIAVDACLEPGPRRPFNFIGMLNEKEMRTLIDLEAKTHESNATIWFGHYPTSAILSSYPGIRHLMRNSLGYFCGHFHTLGGWVPRMYTLQKAGFFELELGDWKDNRLYRVAVIDHGLLSFVDSKHSEWPVILITNPQHALFVAPGLQSLHKMHHSSHIRILAFSVSPVAKVSVAIDGGRAEDCENAKGPLFVLPWQPRLYSKGIHRITVTAQDVEGHEKTVLQPFSLDGTKTTFDLMPRILLMSHLTVAAQITLCLSVCLAVLPLCWVRLMHHHIKAGRMARPRYARSWVRALMLKLWLIATIDSFFYPLVLMAVYVPLGPWFVGYIINNRMGICFAWGMFVDGAYLPGGFTFTFAVLHLWTFNIPLTLLLSHSLDFRYRNVWHSPSPPALFQFLLRHLLFVVLFAFNVYVAYLSIPTYGKMAFFINPIQTWSVVGAFVLWQFAIYIPESRLRHLLSVFPLLHSSSLRDDADFAIQRRTHNKDDT